METLDLLLLTDEVTDEGHNRYKFGQTFNARLFDALGISESDALDVEHRYGAKHYIYESHGANPSVQTTGHRTFTTMFPHRPSLALCNLATVVHAAGFSVRVIDNVLRYPFRLEEMLRVLAKDRPRLVGISTTLILHRRALEFLVAAVRQTSPETLIVLGGPTIRNDASLHFLADIAVLGAGEAPLVSILQALRRDGSVASVADIVYRDGKGAIIYSQGAMELTPQSGKAYRARKGELSPITNWRLYQRGAQNVFPIECSRGCRYNCYYCSYDRGKSVRPISDLRRELLENAEYGITNYRFSDSNFTDGPPGDIDFPLTVCDMICELKLDLQWSCYARVDNMTTELADRMKAAGCFGVFFGVESGDNGILRLMRKGHDVEAALKGIHIAKAAGLHVHANFMVGYPGETEETYRKTLGFIADTRPDSVVLGKFFVNDNSPVMGPRMESFHLEGALNQWQHATMDSEMADELIAAGERTLEKIGITPGSEMQIAERMSLGLSFEESRTCFQMSKELLDPMVSPERKAFAKESLRTLYLHRFPAAIAAEQRLMGLG